MLSILSAILNVILLPFIILIALFHFIAWIVLLSRTHRIDKNTHVLYEQNQYLWNELQDLKAMINHKQN